MWLPIEVTNRQQRRVNTHSVQKLFKTFFFEHQYTIQKMPEQNGVSERMNQTLVEMVRLMLANSRLPEVLGWSPVHSSIPDQPRPY